MLKTWVRIGVLSFVCAWITLLMNNCAMSIEEPTPDHVLDRQAIEATLDVWAENSLPYSDRCVEERKRLNVQVVPREAIDSCAALEPDGGRLVLGCYVSKDVSIWTVAAPPINRQDIVVHETLHWLHECNWGTTDHTHTGLVPSSRAMRDVTVWLGADYDPTSLEMQTLVRL